MGAVARFEPAEVEVRVRQRVHPQVPLPGLDPTIETHLGDDELNPHIPPFKGVPRLAAVLIPLVRRPQGVTVLLTRRTEHLPTHKGQVAFPGGKIDPTDDGALGAALRETHEETGVEPSFVEPIGYMDAYQTRTGFRVVPVVAMVNDGFDVRPEPGEVAEVFEVPLQFLMNPANHKLDKRVWEGLERVFHAMPYGRHYIWGATAGIIHDFYRRIYADG